MFYGAGTEQVGGGGHLEYSCRGIGLADIIL